jgi:uncharacterized protein YjaZ
MGYIPPLHFSAYHQYTSQKNAHNQLPFTFKKVPKTEFINENQQRSINKAIQNYGKVFINETKQDQSVQSILSLLTGVGININELI